jgi:hypothetical protein
VNKVPRWKKSQWRIYIPNSNTSQRPKTTATTTQNRSHLGLGGLLGCSLLGSGGGGLIGSSLFPEGQQKERRLIEIKSRNPDDEKQKKRIKNGGKAFVQEGVEQTPPFAGRPGRRRRLARCLQRQQQRLGQQPK